MDHLPSSLLSSSSPLSLFLRASLLLILQMAQTNIYAMLGFSTTITSTITDTDTSTSTDTNTSTSTDTNTTRPGPITAGGSSPSPGIGTIIAGVLAAEVAAALLILLGIFVVRRWRQRKARGRVARERSFI
jgi:hypothetical protein